MIQLTSKWQPKQIRDFAGLARAKAIMGKLAVSPYASSWIFSGESGTGKTTLALALAAEMNAEVIHVASGDCDKAAVDRIAEQCHYMPMFGSSPWRVVVVDEADRMTPAAQIAWLSHLDCANPIPYAIVIFTCNSTARLEDRFLSRCKAIEFNGQCDADSAIAWLYKVWYAEAGCDVPLPAVLAPAEIRSRLAEKSGNIRSYLNEIEIELMCVGVAA